MRPIQAFLFVASLLLLGTATTGCHSDPAPNPVVEKGRLDKLTAIRDLYDKNGGNYDSMSSDDKATLLKLCDGDQKKADVTWAAMKNGPGAKATSPGG